MNSPGDRGRLFFLTRIILLIKSLLVIDFNRSLFTSHSVHRSQYVSSAGFSLQIGLTYQSRQYPRINFNQKSLGGNRDYTKLEPKYCYFYDQCVPNIINRYSPIKITTYFYLLKREPQNIQCFLKRERSLWVVHISSLASPFKEREKEWSLIAL